MSLASQQTSIMRLHLHFFVLIAAPKAVHPSDPDLVGGPSDQLLFDQNQVLLPSDLAESAVDQQSSAIGNAFWTLSSDNSIPSSAENIASGPIDFSIASDPVDFADCSTSDDSIFSPASKSRLRRQARCDTLDNNVSPPTLSIPSVDSFDENLRGTILRENPGLHETLRLLQKNDDDDNTACYLITLGILPIGVCSSVTVNDWTYRASRTFSWNWMFLVTLWDLSYITPGMVELNFLSPASIDSI